MARQPRVIRHIVTALALLAALGGPVLWQQTRPSPVVQLDKTACEVFFSPDGGCTDAVVRALDGAQSTVLVQAYSFTSAPIAKALAAAYKRGVSVQVILDKSQRTAHYSSATFLANAGIPTFIDDAHAIAHNKVMIIDSHTVITGSFNFTRAAEEKNAENLLIIDNPALAKRYADNWQAHRKHTETYVR